MTLAKSKVADQAAILDSQVDSKCSTLNCAKLDNNEKRDVTTDILPDYRYNII